MISHYKFLGNWGRFVKKLGLVLKIGPEIQMQIIPFWNGQDGKKCFDTDTLGSSIAFSVNNINIKV